MQHNVIDTQKDSSCSVIAFLSKFLLKKGITAEQIFMGIEEHQKTLLNPLEWTSGKNYQTWLQNVEAALIEKSETLFDAARDWALQEKSAFHLFFFKQVPLSILAKKIREHCYKSIHKGIAIELESKRDGEASVYFTPWPGVVYSTQVCDLCRGATFALLSLRGLKNMKLVESCCAARDPGAKFCHYKATWSPRPSLFRALRDLFFLRFCNFKSTIQNLQENQEKLQNQYNETKRMYEQVVQSESRFRSIFENIQDIYIELDHSGIIREISPSIASITSYSRTDLLNKKFQDICLESDALSGILQTLQVHKRISDRDLTLKNKNGDVIACTITARLLKENGRVRLSGVLRDSTERKKAEQEKYKIQEQLRQSEKLQALGRMAGGVAHDFKNQLFGIAANARLIKNKNRQDAYCVTCAENILKSAYRSSELTKQLLAFARSGKFQSVAINLHETVKDLVLLLERTLDKNILIDTKLNAQSTVINGDPSQIENALLNLSFNSRDAMPGGGTLTFVTEDVMLDKAYCGKSEYGVSEGRYIKISIKDTGRGIEKELLGSIFEPFFTTKEMGNGLGLSAVYGTVKEHGGAIEIETQPGVGTTVSLLLPLSASGVSKKESNDEFERVALNKNLLLIEDEEIVRNGAKEALEHAGFTVWAFGNGASALEYYRSNYQNLHLILLDMVLPDMSVQELFGRIQQINPEAPIVLWSAYTLPEIVQSLREKGALDFIDKGCDISAFVRRISELANDKQREIVVN